ncbi:MAG: serine hydrolase [Hyphomicrobiaceae bacterium]|nr:serine hydrolase [Hyphomicrobiaceae bacterium]
MVGERSADAIVPVYSVAKIFIAAAALLQFDSDIPIGALTRVPSRLGHLRLRDLLSHRSGLLD